MKFSIKFRTIVSLILSALLIVVSLNADAAKRRFKLKRKNTIFNSAFIGAGERNINESNKHLKYIHPPKNITGIQGLRRVNGKTSIQGGGKKRERWKDDDGKIYEWDSRHGTLEKYDSNGRHLGEFDPNTGSQIKGKIKSRRVDP